MIHGRGIPLDAHLLDTAAHAAAGLQAAADLAGPEIITPPGALFAATAVSAWYAANFATFMRFTVPKRKAYRWAVFNIGTASGNIQCGVSSLARSGTVINSTRVMSSGVIACPTAGDARVDLTATTLAPGDYALFLWADNTAVTVMHGLATGLASSRLLFAQNVGAGGVGAGVLTLAPSTRWVSGMSLESDS